MNAGFNAVFFYFTVAATLCSQGIQGTVAEQAVKVIRVICFMAGKVFTFPVLEKAVVLGIIWHGFVSP